MYKRAVEKEDNKQITKDYILNTIGEERLFLRYMNYTPNFGEQYINPFRSDKNAGCSFYRDKLSGRLKFKDFSKRLFYDCFDVAKLELSKTKNINNFQQLLNAIAEDFNLNRDKFRLDQQLDILSNDIYEFKLYFKKMSWTKLHIEFWSQYHKKIDYLEGVCHIYPIKEGWLVDRAADKMIQVHLHTTTDIGFVFVFKGCCKFYFPYREERRFYQDSTTYLQGYDLLDYTQDVCVITKAYKDVVCYKEPFNINAVATMSESILPTKKQIIWLKEKFPILVTQVDFDQTGRRFARYLKDKYDIPYLFFTHGELGLPLFSVGVKDFADHVKIEGIDKTQELINKHYERFTKGDTKTDRK